jgi:hypothetical protein
VKNLTHRRLFVFILLLALLIPAGIAYARSSRPFIAQSTTPTVTPAIIPTLTPGLPPVSPPLALYQIPGLLQTDVKPPIPDTTELFTFEQFGFDEITMRGPFAAQGYYFDLPATWKMKQGASMQLTLDTYYTGPDSDASTSPRFNYGGSLEIQYNYITIGRVDLIEGRTQVDIPIPLEALNRYGGNQGHAIQFILDSGINCDINSSTTLVVRSTSQLYMPHDLIAPPVDLRLLPSPFSQDSFNQDTAIIIIPNQPTQGELQAALSISAGFGSMSYNSLLISLIPSDQATEDILESANLIFVGKAEGLPLLQRVTLPAPVSNGLFAAKGSAPTDGIVQMAVSPWNTTKVVMVIGGNDDNGVINAAWAASTGEIQAGANPSLALVSGVQLVTPEFNLTDVNQTFADLDYDSQVVNQAGTNVLEYVFNIPAGFVIGPDAYLDLNFSHSALLEYQRSTIVVDLNDQPVGSVRLSDETTGRGNAKIFLPASAARPGINTLSLRINLEPRNECVNPLLNGLWMRIDSSSSFHLPLVPNLTSTSTLIDLGKYPFPFAFDPLMKDLAFVLSENDPTGWNVAAQVASQLGNVNRAQLAGLEAYYASAVPDTARRDRNLIIVGRPGNLEILSELSDALPASFEPGTELISQKNIQVSYRLEPGVDVGYLELLPAPWNSDRTILYVGGSSDLGLRWAGAALQFGRLRSQLKGNLAIINGEQVVSAETRILQDDHGALLTPAPVEETPGANQPVMGQKPAWILPSIFIALGGIALVLVILGAQVLFRRRSGK